MGGSRLIGLLCLLSRAVLPGFALEVSTNQSADLGSEVPAAATVSSFVTSGARRDSASVVSELPDVTPGGKTNGTAAVPDPPPSEGPPAVSQSEPFAATSAITVEPQETKNSTGGAPNPETGPSLTRQPPTAHTLTTPVMGPPTDHTLTTPVMGPPTDHTLTTPVMGPPTDHTLTTPVMGPPTAHTLTTPVTGEVTTGTPNILTEGPLLPGTPTANTEAPPGSTHPAAATSAATPTAATPHTIRSEEEGDPSLLEVGDVREVPHLHTGSASNPLFVMIVSVFTIMVVMVVVGVGFHRYKKRNRRTDFRRLQDLPMDDMMEDTPLALYSY